MKFFLTQFRRFSDFIAIGINCFILSNSCRGIIFPPRLHQKASKLSLKVLFFKAFPQSDGLICAGPLME